MYKFAIKSHDADLGEEFILETNSNECGGI